MITRRVWKDATDYAGIAAESMKRPDHYGTTDDRQYRTHGPFIGRSRDSDNLEESNFDMARECMDEFGSDEGPDNEPDWFIASATHWLVGWVESIYVRWYDGDGNPTPSGRRAAAIVAALREYPVLDEEDYQEREQAEIWSLMEQALGDASFPYDDPESVRVEAGRLWMSGECPKIPDDVPWEDAEGWYRQARDNHYTKVGEAFLAAERAHERRLYMEVFE